MDTCRMGEIIGQMIFPLLTIGVGPTVLVDMKGFDLPEGSAINIKILPILGGVRVVAVMEKASGAEKAGS